MGVIQKLRQFLLQCNRILHISSKPDKNEIRQSAKITGIGIVIIGVIGFIIFLIFTFIGAV